MSSELPTDVQTFLEEHIRSYDQLHVLLLLRTAPDRLWSCDAVGLELGMSTDSAAAALHQLLEKRLVTVAGGGVEALFRLSSAASEREDTLTRVADAYDDQKVAIVQWMTDHAVERVRAGAQNLLASIFARRSKRRAP
jgi:hypothetical protein